MNSRNLERGTGIEPASSAWKAEALPLSYPRTSRHCEKRSNLHRGGCFASLAMTTTMVGGEGLEPPKALGRLIYSQLRLPLRYPPMTIEIIRL